MIYARVSGEEQKGSDQRIPSQIKLSEEETKADSIVAAHKPIVDIETGQTLEREGLKLLWNLARSGSIDHVSNSD